MAYIIQNPIAGAQSIAESSATQRHPLGLIVQAVDPTYGAGEFKYMIGVANCVVGSWVDFVGNTVATALLGPSKFGPCGISMSINGASQYGWYQINGKAVGKALTGYLDGALVYATSTAGSVDDAVVTGDRVMNAQGASAVDAPGTGLALFDLNRPFMDDGAAN